MEASYILILGFVLWTLLLLGTLGIHRTSLVFLGRHRPNTFKPWGEDVSPFSYRLCRAHANCYENLAIVLAVVSIGYFLNQLNIINQFAILFLILRILQSIVHVISTSALAVIIRFILFIGQYLILLYWIIRLILTY
ncbi:MAG: MAPEG family protein [Pseudomonadota bacterium]